MMVRTQISLESELQRLARQRASESGISLAEYVRRVVARDLAQPETRGDITCIFDLGASSEATDIAKDKDSMIAEAFESTRRRHRR